MRVCVFGSSSKQTKMEYCLLAHRLGELIGERGFTCVNGGGCFGVMGYLNKGCREKNGRIIGVIHEMFIVDSGEDRLIKEMIISKGKDLSERKQLLIENGDAIIVLPGGVGTFDELWDCVSGKSLRLNGLEKVPIVVLNFDGFYDGTLAQLERAHKDGLLYAEPSTYLHVETDIVAALDWCESQLAPQNTSAPLDEIGIYLKNRKEKELQERQRSRMRESVPATTVTGNPLYYVLLGITIGCIASLALRKGYLRW